MARTPKYLRRHKKTVAWVSRLAEREGYRVRGWVLVDGVPHIGIGKKEKK